MVSPSQRLGRRMEVAMSQFLHLIWNHAATWPILSGVLSAVLSAFFSIVFTRSIMKKGIAASIKNNVVNIHKDMQSLWERLNGLQSHVRREPPSKEKIEEALDSGLSNLGDLITHLGDYIRDNHDEKYQGELEAKWLKDEEESSSSQVRVVKGLF